MWLLDPKRRNYSKLRVINIADDDVSNLNIKVEQETDLDEIVLNSESDDSELELTAPVETVFWFTTEMFESYGFN